MKIYNKDSEIPKKKSVVALGTFDGFHRAHRRLFKKAKGYAIAHGLAWGALLFVQSPKEVLQHQKNELLTTTEEKLALLHRVDFVYLQEFDREFMELSCREFVLFLKERLNAAAVCAGFNYRFGYKAQGDAALLKELCAEQGIEVIILERQTDCGQQISSTAVRDYIRVGRVDEAKRLLGRSFSITGKVVRGFQNGQKMGFPTANVEYEPHRMIPKRGVYAGITVVDGEQYLSVINVGTNPTFDGKQVTVETHILDFDRDIYDQTITVKFRTFLREDQKFSNIDQLTRQIQRDVEAARKLQH